MNILVTGGAGFIGRWVVKNLLETELNVLVIDNLDNGIEENLLEFKTNKHLKDFVIGDIRQKNKLKKLFKDTDICIHLAAQINVQESLENPQKAYEVNVLGTYNILEFCRSNNTKLVLVSTCMVYDTTDARNAISEDHPLKPASPYAGSKLAAEDLAMSYFYGYKLPLVILRPFNTYGPFQKSNMEGGVVSIFVKDNLEGKYLDVFGDGTQTRDLLYVEDCADFIVKSAVSEKAIGQVINAGLGKDISINDLAYLISNDRKRIKNVPHHHPQAEIPKLLCNYDKAEKILGWEPKTCLKEGIAKTIDWIKKCKN